MKRHVFSLCSCVFLKYILILVARFTPSVTKVAAVKDFILKDSTGSIIFDRFHGLYPVIGRSALHVAALRGTGHRLALTAPHTHDFSWRRHLAHLAGEKYPSARALLPAADRACTAYTHGCRYCERLLHLD